MLLWVMSKNTALSPMAKNNKPTKKKFFSNGRIKRGTPPIAQLKRTTYRKALPELRRDFNDRCAYCMRHIATETEMQVDHFDPRRKNDKTQVYSNLFLADAHCNGAKGDSWPTPEETKLGCRFLNCCTEEDYGKVIFEDPKTHILKGTTASAIYHIETIDLNDPGLIEERRHRAEIFAKLNLLTEKSKNNPEILQAITKLTEMTKNLIPDIPPPPGYWTVLP